MSAIQATLSIYEREVGPRPEKVSCTRKMLFLTCRGSELYSLFW